MSPVLVITITDSFGLGDITHWHDISEQDQEKLRKSWFDSHAADFMKRKIELFKNMASQEDLNFLKQQFKQLSEYERS